MPEPIVSVVIVSYNTLAMTLACIESVLKHEPALAAEIIVIDNASADGSADAIAARYPQVRLLRSAENLGFARANNVAATGARGGYLLLLNPDTLLVDGAIGRLLEFARSNPAAKIWGGRTVFADGSLNPASCLGFMTLRSQLLAALGISSVFSRSETLNPEHYGNWQRDSVRQVDVVVGCFLLIAREFWVELEGFDPRFFMYAEETDLCYRARRRGARPMLTPDATIVHFLGASEPLRAAKMQRLLKGKMTYFRKHWPPRRASAGLFVLKAHVLIRLLAYGVGAAISGSDAMRKPAAEWREVWRSRHAWSEGYPL